MDQKILKQLEQLQKTVTSIETNMVTKDDLKNALEKQAEDFGEIVNALFVSTDERKADKEVVVVLDKRITHIERKLVV